MVKGSGRAGKETLGKCATSDNSNDRWSRYARMYSIAFSGTLVVVFFPLAVYRMRVAASC